jgi:hypothetical protein
MSRMYFFGFDVSANPERSGLLKVALSLQYCCHFFSA